MGREPKPLSLEDLLRMVRAVEMQHRGAGGSASPCPAASCQS
jgi:hypothetical protein